MMQYFLAIVLVVIVGTLHVSVAPPVTQNKESEKENEIGHETDDELEYQRYVTEVVQLLEGDPQFRQKLEKANEVDIRTGKIADALDLVSHHVRSKLDELKRKELHRLKKLVAREKELENGHDLQHSKVAKHLDHEDPKGFGIQDLKKLIAKVTEDIKEADEKRREEFKEYEMQKKFEEEQKLAAMDEKHKKEYQEQSEAMEKKHKEHQPLHHPGSKQQLEEVWEKQDHMDPDNFDPKTFFLLHDLDGNGFWDQTEVKALFLKELDKLYQQGTSNEDLVKRGEEMERMREHVFAEADLDKDGVISYHEFLKRTENPSFQKDEGWEGLDDQQIYSPEEYHNYEKRRLEELQHMVAQGMPPVHPDSYPVHPDQFPSQYANHQVQQGMPPHNQMHGQQQPMHMSQSQYQGLPPQQQQYHDQVAYQQAHTAQQQLHQAQVQYNNQFQGHQQQSQQIPPQGHHPAQVLYEQQNPAGAGAAAAAHQQQPPPVPVNPGQPQGVLPPQQQQPGQIPQQQPGQVPQQQPGQVPQQQSGQVPQQQPGQVPQQQPGQIPQQQSGQVPQQQQLNSQNSVLQQQPPNTLQQNINQLPNDLQHPMPAAAHIQQQIHQNSIPNVQKL